MNRVGKLTLLISLLSATLASAQAANLYKWTDEDGSVHYSQTPPTQRPTKVITTVSSAPAPAQAPAVDEVTKANESGAAPLPEGMSQSDDAAAQLKRQNCEAARTNLATYQSFSKIIEPDGTEIVLSNEMREAKLKEAQEQIKLYCE